jgi:hypothetical protein
VIEERRWLRSLVQTFAKTGTGRWHSFIEGAKLKVLAEHAEPIKVPHILRPFAVAMAGAGEFDPFKD